VALDRRLKGRGLRATALHPGGIQTELSRHMTPELWEQLRACISLSTGNNQTAFRYKDRAARCGDQRMGRAWSHHRMRLAGAIAKTAMSAR
jgi:NAD(P)-dependent dehydrogenase (short-subunit alcohol dehydrogenase family)